MIPVLEVRGLCKAFGALSVTSNVSLAIDAGELHAVIGPNGAGKTSLIGQVMGTLAPDSGAILLDGREITQLRPHARARLGLARSFQITSLVGSFTALENVSLVAQGLGHAPLRPFGSAAKDEALNAPARAALESVGLGARTNVPARALAHGEQRALELACALVGTPRCLVLDEPLAGMGHGEAEAIIALLGGLKRRYAILLVEHDMDAVFALADRVSVLVEGRITASGDPGLVRNDPTVRTAYLGDAPGDVTRC